MPGRIERKWRPPLLLVLGGTVGMVLMLPPAGLMAVRLLTDGLRYRTATLIVGLAVLMAAALLAFLLWRLLLRPIRALAMRADHLAAGGRGAAEPLEHYGTAELHDLGQSVLTMASALQNREATVRAFTDHVSHEFKAPLTAIRGAAELLQDDPGLGTENSRLAETIARSVARLDTLLGALREVAAAREPRHLGETRLSDLLDALQARFPTLKIRASGSDQSFPIAHEGLLIVLTHLAENAIAAGADELTLTASQSPALIVADNGPGISEGNQDDIFKPFFTTRRATGGTGMGLAIARSLIEAHSGTIALVPSETGARFCISWD